MCFRGLFTFFVSLPLAAAQHVAIVSSSALDAPARHGLEVLKNSLAAKGFTTTKTQADFFVLAGLRSGAKPQSVAIRSTNYRGKPAIDLGGGDSTGLMYAAL